jgi:hypothetical protein
MVCLHGVHCFHGEAPKIRNERLINGLRIGHTFLTHACRLLEKESPPQCSARQTQLAVEHVLLLCTTWNATASIILLSLNLLVLFNQVTPHGPSCIVDLWKKLFFVVEYETFTSVIFMFSPFLCTAFTLF